MARGDGGLEDQVQHIFMPSEESVEGSSISKCLSRRRAKDEVYGA